MRPLLGRLSIIIEEYFARTSHMQVGQFIVSSWKRLKPAYFYQVGPVDRWDRLLYQSTSQAGNQQPT